MIVFSFSSEEVRSICEALREFEKACDGALVMIRRVRPGAIGLLAQIEEKRSEAARLLAVLERRKDSDAN